MGKFRLHEMSWPEAKEYFSKNDTAILPVGSTEQHGLHNPLGTDHLIAKALAEETARRTGILCLPVVPFGVSSHHRQFWGTIHVRPKILKEYVRDICLSLKAYGVRKLLLVNGHGGNTAALIELARELREREEFFMVVFQWWPLTGKLLPELFSREERGHAGAEETSLNLYLHPQLVNMEKAVDETPNWIISIPEGFNLSLDTVDYKKSGVFGKSSTANPEKGKKVFETVVNQLVKIVEELKRMKIEDLKSKNLV